jgi:phosphoribosylglycinamide formyltransferase-1
MKTILLFASGGGSNVKAILDYFKDKPSFHFPLIITNKKNAGVIDIAAAHGIDVLLIDKIVFDSPVFLDTLELYKPSLLVLGGFLWKIPDYLIKAFPNRIVNIHPSLLPQHGGKGMYGHHVHEAVLAQGDSESGITIHLVNEQYDKGTILLQKKVPVTSDDTPSSLAAKVLVLEHAWYSKVIESLCS